ncbi:MAG: peptidylprolyl isomerase [Treponema sp.]|jgi:parvulin-like peptidyl-prolyl isomerase|nr:peptidylprolyl isomerase [Treponema sp.]
MKQFFSILLVLIVASVSFAQNDLQPAAIVRLTKSEPITVKQLRTEVERMEKTTGRTLTAAEKRQVLDVMINEKLAIQAAERDKITVSDAEINQQIQQLRAGMVQSIGRQPTDAEFALAVKNETGLDVPAFRDMLRKQALTQKYLMSKKQDIFSSVKPPTEEEILNTYNLSQAEFVRPQTVRFSYIQVSFGNPSDKVKAKETIDRLAREMSGDPAKFDEIAVRSQTPNSGYQGGDGGYLPRNRQAAQRVGDEFINIAFSLKQGEVSKVIEGPRGYQIIKITETYSMKPLELTDIAQLGSRLTVRDYIGNVLLQQKQAAIVEKASQELVAELRTGSPFQIIESNINW